MLLHRISYQKKKCEIHNNIKVHVSIPYKKKASIDVPLRLFYKLCVLDPDIVIQRAAGTPTGVCALYCSIINKRFIYSIAHKIDVNGTAEQGIFGKFFKYGLRKANFIVAQNNDQKKILKKKEWK